MIITRNRCFKTLIGVVLSTYSDVMCFLHVQVADPTFSPATFPLTHSHPHPAHPIPNPYPLPPSLSPFDGVRIRRYLVPQKMTSKKNIKELLLGSTLF